MRGVLAISVTLLVLTAIIAHSESRKLATAPSRFTRRCWPLRCRPPHSQDDCASQDLIYEIKSRYGRQCIGCEICKTDLPFCVVACLAFIPPCADDERLTRDLRIIDGQQCQGCLKCEKKDAPVKCPRKDCPPAPGKQFCTNLQTRGDYYLPDGTKCDGCPFCALKDIFCPVFPCPNPGPCAVPGRPYDFFGKECRQCASPGTCDFFDPVQPLPPVKPECNFACPACAPPPGYVSPGPDENGCTPCPPCGNGGSLYNI